jgi:hypothetical protein
MKVYPTLKAVTPLDDYHLMLTFGNGEKRVYDFKPNLTHKFYSSLSDVKLFKAVSVVDGEIEWVTGQDFCPHTLYEEGTVVSNNDIDWGFDE